MNVKKYVRALLWLYLTLIIAMDAVKAQPLKVGDTLPPDLWSMPLQVVNHPQGKETITLEEYKDKLIILDFWATWCAPCIKSMIHLDPLQSQFKNSLAVVPVTYEDQGKVLPFLLKRKLGLLSVVQNKELEAYFPHQVIPHQVWIQGGAVLAITDGAYSTAENVKKILHHKPVKMISKGGDKDFDPASLLEMSDQAHFESCIKGQVNEGVGSLFVLKGNGLVKTNSTAESLFKTALAWEFPFVDISNRIKYNLPDSTIQRLKLPEVSALRTFEEDSVYHEWLKNNTFTYYNRYAERKPRHELFQKMREDIGSYFRTAYGIEAGVERRRVTCYVIKRNSGFLHTADYPDSQEYHYVFEDKPLSLFIENLALFTAMQPFPIVDESEYTGNVSIKLQSSFSDIIGIRNDLNRYGLDLAQEVCEIEMLVFKPTESK